MCSSDCPCHTALPRRAFIAEGALGALGTLLLSACGDAVGGTYPTDPFPTTPFSIRISEYPQLAAVGGMVRVQGATGGPVAIMRTGAASFEAISMVCPHQGAIVEFAGSPAFRCPSHLAEFAADGTWIGGKQTGDLTVLGVTFNVSAGTLTIDGPAADIPAPTMSVVPSTEVFAATQNGANPAAQTVGITNTGGGTLTGLGVVIGYAAGQPSGWLTATLDTQTAPATLTLQPTTKPLAQGAYAATVQVTAPTATNAPQAVTVSFLISAAVALPSINLTPPTVAFAAAAGGANPAGQQVAIANGGGGALTGLAVGSPAYDASASGWLAASLTGTTAPASLVLTPTLGALSVGSHTAMVPVIATGASNTPQQVTVTFTVAAANAPPTLSLSVATVAFAATQNGGSGAPQTITIQNAGGGSLGALSVGTIVYGTGGSGWLASALSGPAAPATLTLTASPLDLLPGTYTATVPVTSVGVANSPQMVTVSMTIAPAATLVISPASVSLTASAGTSPGGQVVNVTSSGTPLTGLALTISYGSGATGWLVGSSLNATTTPAALTVRAASTALAAGTYTATVQVNATGTPATTIAVTLVVVPAGLAVTIANWPTLANAGGIAGSVGVVQGTPTAVVRTSQTTFAAFSMRCPHQGTTIRIENWNGTGSAFHCPNHNALFDSAGHILPNSPLRTSNLVVRTVSYAPGATTLYIT